MALVMMAILFFSISQMAAQAAASISENSCSEVPAEADAEQSGCLMQTKHQIFNERAVDDTHKKAPKSKPQKKDEEVDESDKKTRPHKVAKVSMERRNMARSIVPHKISMAMITMPMRTRKRRAKKGRR